MSAHRSIRPSASEHAEFYAGYIRAVPEGDVLDALIAGEELMTALLSDLSEEEAEKGYAPGKWTIKEVIQHCSDAERIFAYRALRIARGDKTDLPGWDENAYAPMSKANERSLEELLDEFESVREATMTLFAGLPAEAWERRGTANGHEVSVRAIAWINAGHVLHHCAVLQERYL